MKEKRINILGSGPGRLEVPSGKGEIWGVNNVHLLQDVDLIVDIHNRVNPKEEKDRVHMKELGKKGIPTYSQDKIEGFDNVKKYPVDEIIKEFGVDYFGSGIDYIIALAIYEGATDIHMYGVCMMDKSEYTHQKASVEFWIGVAMGRGINVTVHGEYPVILKTKDGLLYGYKTFQQYVKDESPDEVSMMDLVRKYE